jgi:alkaline phosphatase D
LNFKPQLWIWLGDNIYGDTNNMEILAEKWATQKANPGYQRLLATCPVVGLWDDHDFGRNDAGFEYKWKKQSQQLFLDFLDEPKDSSRRKQEGIYEARTFGPEGQQVCVILLDVRYYRPPPRSGGDIIGEAQWRWIQKTLRESKAQIHFIASGSQILPTEHRWEKWADFPDSRRRLFKLLADLKTPGVVLLSGDRHFAEISMINNPVDGTPLVEMTTSGMTHVWNAYPGEKNSLRVGEEFVALNFGTAEIDWQARKIVLSIRDDAGNPVRSITTEF